MKTFWLSLTIVFLGGSSMAQASYSVYVFLAEKCPISIYMVQPLQEAYELFGEEIDFYAVFPMKNSTEESADKFLEKYELNNFKIKLDNYQGFARKLNASITPEAVLMDTEGNILYRGRISDAYKAPGKMKHGPRQNELVKVLGRTLVGEGIPKPWPDAVGCYITFHK